MKDLFPTKVCNMFAPRKFNVLDGGKYLQMPASPSQWVLTNKDCCVR